MPPGSASVQGLLVAVRIREHLIDALVLNARNGAVLARDDVDRLAGTRAEDARMRQSDSARRAAALSNRGIWKPALTTPMCVRS
jgi:hypothetical protein